MLTFLNWLIDIALRRATVMAVVVAAVVIGGLLAVRQIKLELLPDINYPVMTVVTTYPGAAPQDVVEGVTKPTEGAASTLSGLKRMQSISSEGLSIVLLEFGFGTNMAKREQELTTRLRDVAFPSTAAQPQISLVNTQLLPVTEMSLAGDLPVEELERIAREQVVPALSEIDGVLQVEVIGGAVSQVDVVLDPAKLREAGLSSQGIASAIQAANTAIPSGSVTTEEKTVPLRTLSSIDSLDKLESLVVGVRPDPAGGEGTPVLLKDVAQVSLGRSETAGAARTNGKASVAIAVSKSPEANTVQVADRVNDTIKRLQRDLGSQAQFLTIYDQSTQIKNSIWGMLREGGWGALFAVVVVFLFLLSLRSTLVTAVSIPLSVVVALLLMYWLGLTLNIFTLGGLTIAIGRVIDDSIVVLENIYRHVHQDGESLESAVRSAPREVASAITSSTLTTVAVFVPLGLMGGLVGELFRPFGLTVTFALLASLAVALMIVPGLARLVVGKGAVKSSGSRDTWLQKGYAPVLRWCLRNRLITVAVAVALFVISMFMLRSVPVSLLPNMTEDVFDVTVIAPAGSDMDTILSEAAKVEEVVAKTEGVRLYETVVGGQTQSLYTLGAVLSGRGFSTARIFVRVEEGASLSKVADRVREEVQGIKSNSLISVSDMQTSTLSRLQVTAWSDDPEALAQAGQEILAAAAKVDGVANLTSDAGSERTEIAIDVDPNKAFLAGLSAQEVSYYIRSLLLGQTVTQMVIDGGSSVNVQLSISREGVGDVGSLQQLLIGPQAVPLSSIAEVKTVSAQAQVSRVDERPAVTVNGDIVSKETGDVAKKVRSEVNKLDLPASVDAEVGGVLSQIEESFSSMYIGIGIAVILVYIVMIIFFGSLLEPFAILFSLPLASIGAFFALSVTHNTLGLSALIGLLMLVGIVVTNAIVLIDLVKHLAQQGMDPHEALIQGGRTRLRPILMTAVATMLALIPLAMGFHQGTIIATELATVVIGGLFTSTLLTLVVVPVVYSLLLDLRTAVLGRRPSTATVKVAAQETGDTPPPRSRRLPRPSKKRE